MPIAFLLLGMLTIALTILACCGMATDYGLTSLVYFLAIILLIGLEIGLGAYWVNIHTVFIPDLLTTPAVEENSTVPSTFEPTWTTSEYEFDYSLYDYSTDSTDSTDSITTVAESLQPLKVEKPTPIPKPKPRSRPPPTSRRRKVVVASFSDFRYFERQEKWRSFQLTFKCCGINGASDFIDKGKGVPPECCKARRVNENSTELCELTKYAQNGCLEALLVRLFADRLILGTLSIIAGSLTLIMLVTSFFIRFDDDVNSAGGELFEGDEFCGPSDCGRESAIAHAPIIPGPLQVCVPDQQQSPPCCRKYPPCQCAPKLRQCWSEGSG